jgi:predicted anti-sigma-YlaC factor YlaD
MEQTITCKELVELVTDYLEGKLPDDLHMSFENHLLGCRGCTNYLEQMRETIRLTGKLQEEDLAAQQKEDLLAIFRNWKNK